MEIISWDKSIRRQYQKLVVYKLYPQSVCPPRGKNKVLTLLVMETHKNVNKFGFINSRDLRGKCAVPSEIEQ